MIGHIVWQWTSQGASQVAIVCAAGDEVMAAELDRIGFPGANRIGNPEPERGMFSSLQCAAAWSGWGLDLTHWAIVLGDQPHLRPATLAQLCEFGCSNPGRICQPSLAGRPRHPVPTIVFHGDEDTTVHPDNGEQVAQARQSLR